MALKYNRRDASVLLHSHTCVTTLHTLYSWGDGPSLAWVPSRCSRPFLSNSTPITIIARHRITIEEPSSITAVVLMICLLRQLQSLCLPVLAERHVVLKNSVVFSPDHSKEFGPLIPKKNVCSSVVTLKQNQKSSVWKFSGHTIRHLKALIEYYNTRLFFYRNFKVEIFVMRFKKIKIN